MNTREWDKKTVEREWTLWNPQERKRYALGLEQAKELGFGSEDRWQCAAAAVLRMRRRSGLEPHHYRDTDGNWHREWRLER